jgi:hypothetical protein
MAEHRSPKGIDVQFPNGHTEHVHCETWWVGDGVLYTDKVRVQPTHPGAGYTYARGPAFPLVNVKKWEETR